ncbi:MAG TPA: 4Fe-4S dicluster domain-containing protein [Pseudomonadota bacterium]|nr:4Fe-4S dicluster domain-containing protein [Pseudomonadota bacterium]
MSAPPSHLLPLSTAGAAGRTPPAALPERGELPPYTATVLGARRAELARELRRRLLAAGLTWPQWIDARPGRLQVILGDCSDPPLGASAAALVARHGELLLEGLAALGLISGVARLVLCASEPATVAALRALCAERAVAVVATPPVYPSCPEADVAGASGHAYTVPAAQLAAIGALVRGASAPQLCTLAGAVEHPQVVDLPAPSAGLAPARATSATTASDPAAPSAMPTSPSPGSAAMLASPSHGGATESAIVASPSHGGATPAELVRRCGGAQTPAWVAVLGGALGGVLWPADAPLPAGTSLCLILPAAHELVVRLRRGEAWRLRARNACLSCQACTDFCPVNQAGVPLFPHRLMRAHAALQPPGDAVAAPAPALNDSAAVACTGCGACSVVCPADLLPGALVKELGLATAGLPTGTATSPEPALLPPRQRPPALPAPRVGERRLPLPLVLTRLGLDAYGRPLC